jgi:hypothetical protein
VPDAAEIPPDAILAPAEPELAPLAAGDEPVAPSPPTYPMQADSAMTAPTPQIPSHCGLARALHI